MDWWLDLFLCSEESETGILLAPQEPGLASKIPAQVAWQNLHFPSKVKFHSDNSYQFLPIKIFLHWWQ